MKISHSFHCFPIKKFCVLFEHFSWAKITEFAVGKVCFLLWDFQGTSEVGYLGCWVSWQTDSKPQRGHKTKHHWSSVPTVPWVEAQAAEPGWAAGRQHSHSLLCQTALQGQHRLLTAQGDSCQIRHSVNSSDSSASKTLLTLRNFSYKWKEKHIL